MATRDDGFNHRHADARDGGVRKLRSSRQMVFDDPDLMNIVSGFVKGQNNKINFGSVNKVTKEEGSKYRSDTYKEVLGDIYRKDAFNDQYIDMQTNQNYYLNRPAVAFKPNEQASRSNLAQSLYGAGWPVRSPLFPVSRSEFRKAPGVYK